LPLVAGRIRNEYTAVVEAVNRFNAVNVVSVDLDLNAPAQVLACCTLCVTRGKDLFDADATASAASTAHTAVQSSRS
jgi:hypothetical protein